eukprot:1856075-Amphidinium_carterae.1
MSTFAIKSGKLFFGLRTEGATVSASVALGAEGKVHDWCMLAKVSACVPTIRIPWTKCANE